MNASEARRAALTAAVAWCKSPDGDDMSTDVLLGYAVRFEEWLTRPAADTAPEPAPLPGAWRAPKRVRPNPYCTVCEHAPHGPRTCSEACTCPGYATCTCVDHGHTRPGWLRCTHDGCACSTSRQAPAGCACTFETVYLACPSCGHDRHEPGECACTSTYTGVMLPQQRAVDGAADPVCSRCGHTVHGPWTCTPFGDNRCDCKGPA